MSASRSSDSNMLPAEPATAGESLLLSATAQRHLHEVLHAGGPESGLEDQLRRSAAAIVNEARRRNMLVEEMLVLLKAEWATLLEEHGSHLGDRTRALTNRLVSHCIQLYYAPPSEQ